MAITVEDGTGLADAETYGSVEEFRAFCSGWGYSLTGKSDGDCEVGLRKGAAFVDTFGRYKGARLVSTQALEFPREGLTDWGGTEVEGVPSRVKRATFELAFKALSEDLLEDLDRGGRIASEGVGPLQVSYEAGAPEGKVYRLATKLLEPFLRSGLPTMSQVGRVVPETDAIFSLGMHDAPGGSELLSEED